MADQHDAARRLRFLAARASAPASLANPPRGRALAIHRRVLDFEADKHGPACRSIRLIARDGAPPIGARTVRGVPVQECINTAIGAAAVREEHRPGVKVITFGGGSRDVTEQHTLAAQVAPRMTDEHLREVADIYSRALEKPTRAVHDHFAPVSYSTAARWVSHARQRGFLPPTGRGSAARKKD